MNAPIAIGDIDDAREERLIGASGCNANTVYLFPILIKTTQVFEFVHADGIIRDRRNKATWVEPVIKHIHIAVIQTDERRKGKSKTIIATNATADHFHLKFIRHLDPHFGHRFG